MSDYFEIVDHNGNKVVCSRNTWFGHIVTNHVIMDKNKAAVMDAVHDPDSVYEDKEYDNRLNFLKASSLATYSAKMNTKVVVEYDEKNKGQVVTAYPTKTKGVVGDEVYKR